MKTVLSHNEIRGKVVALPPNKNQDLPDFLLGGRIFVV